MKITIEENPATRQIEVLVKCARRDPLVERIVSAVSAADFALAVSREGEQAKIFADDIFYIESVDGRTFVYSEKEFFECAMKLYELEERLERLPFARISKSVIVNIKKISRIKAVRGARFEAELSNGTLQIVNRHYVRPLKEKFQEVFE